MKKLLLASALVLASLSTAVFAGDWGDVRASASGYAGGFAGTAMNGRSYNWSKQDADSTAIADTDPAFGLGAGSLSQSTGGYGSSHEGLSGELHMYGDTGASAQVGRRGQSASTTTQGHGNLSGMANGDGRHSHVTGSLMGHSEQSSVVLDTGHGGFDDALAEQSVVGSVHATASGPSTASTGASVGVSASASVDD